VLRAVSCETARFNEMAKTVMKELKMKRIIVLLATLLLSFGLTYGAGNGTFEVKATSPNAWSGQSNAFEFWIANDIVMAVSRYRLQSM